MNVFISSIFNSIDPESRLSSPRPMTPRRVKRRSVNSRGTTPNSAHRSNIILPQYYHHNNLNPPSHHTHHHTHRQSHTRSSLRSSQRRHRMPHQNPVTRLIEQQQKSLHQCKSSFIFVLLALITFH